MTALSLAESLAVLEYDFLDALANLKQAHSRLERDGKHVPADVPQVLALLLQSRQAAEQALALMQPILEEASLVRMAHFEDGEIPF